MITVRGALMGKFGYQGRDEAVVQVVAMVLVAVYFIYAAKTSDANSRQKLGDIKEAQSRTEGLLPGR